MRGMASRHVLFKLLNFTDLLNGEGVSIHPFFMENFSVNTLEFSFWLFFENYEKACLFHKT